MNTKIDLSHSSITLRILPLLVGSREAWEHTRKDGWRLKTGYVNKELHTAREALFYDEVYFPKMRRMLAWVRAFDILPDADWQPVELGYNRTFQMLYPNDIEAQEWLDAVFGPYFEELSGNGDWAWEDLKEDEILRLCGKPGFVSDQLSMFERSETDA